MNEDKDGEFSGLAARLRGADFTGESRVKDALKERLLAKAEKRESRKIFIWALPAAVALAAGLFMVNLRQDPRPGAAPASSYNLAVDGFGECGRQGLGDYSGEGRF